MPHELSQMKSEMSRLTSEMPQLKGELSRMKGEMSRLTSEMSRMKGEMSRLTSEMSRMKGEMSRLTSEMPQLKGEMSQLKSEMSHLKRPTHGARRTVTLVSPPKSWLFPLPGNRCSRSCSTQRIPQNGTSNQRFTMRSSFRDP